MSDSNQPYDHQSRCCICIAIESLNLKNSIDLTAKMEFLAHWDLDCDDFFEEAQSAIAEKLHKHAIEQLSDDDRKSYNSAITSANILQIPPQCPICHQVYTPDEIPPLI